MALYLLIEMASPTCREGLDFALRENGSHINGDLTATDKRENGAIRMRGVNESARAWLVPAQRVSLPVIGKLTEILLRSITDTLLGCPVLLQPDRLILRPHYVSTALLTERRCSRNP